MPGPNPLSAKNAPLSPAASDLGLGDQLVQSLQDQMDLRRKQQGKPITGMGMYAGLSGSPTVAALGMQQNA